MTQVFSLAKRVVLDGCFFTSSSFRLFIYVLSEMYTQPFKGEHTARKAGITAKILIGTEVSG